MWRKVEFSLYNDFNSWIGLRPSFIYLYYPLSFSFLHMSDNILWLLSVDYYSNRGLPLWFFPFTL